MSFSMEINALQTTTFDQVLIFFRGNQSAVSRALGISRSSVRKMIDEPKAHVITVVPDGQGYRFGFYTATKPRPRGQPSTN